MRRTTTTMDADRLTVPVSHRDHLQGSIEAATTLLEYGDFECPACGAAYPMVKAVQESLGESLCFAFRNFPLTNIHPHAEHAAEAAEAAGAQGKFWEMHDALYENQDALEDEDLASYGTDLGLDADRLLSEVLSHSHLPRIQEDFRGGIRSGVNGTPTFYINNIRYNGAYDVESLLAAIRDEAG